MTDFVPVPGILFPNATNRIIIVAGVPYQHFALQLIALIAY